MKMNIKTAVLISALAITVNFSFAQTDDRKLDRQVDVSRDYTPDVERAMKLPIAPDISDTVSLRPDFEYSITPNPWVSGLGVNAINPVKVSPSAYNPVYPFYLKAGAGVPGQTLLDLYANTTGTGGGHAGAYINHYGQYGKIKNDIGYKSRGMHSTNSIGAFGKALVGRRMSVQGEVGFDYDVWSRYGQSVDMNNLDFYTPNEISGPLQSYSIPRAKVLFGHDFEDLSYLNFRVGAGTNMITDRNDNKETAMNMFFEVGKMFSVHNFILKGEFDGSFGGDSLQGNINRAYKLGLDYSIETRKFKIGAGVDYVNYSQGYGNGSSLPDRVNIPENDILAPKYTDSKSYFMPRFKISYDFADGGFIPYAKLESSIESNSYYNLTRRNPYVNPRERMSPTATRKYDFRAGITGSIATNFMYNVYVGGGVHKDPVLFYTQYLDDPQTSAFGVVRDKKMDIFTVGAEMDVRISGSFSGGLAARFYDYSMKNLDKASGLPKFEGSLYLKYNYKDKFKVRFEAELIGERKTMEYSWFTPAGGEQIYYNKQKAAVDLTLEAEYLINKGFGVFLLGRNLANSKLYRFNHYQDRGINVSAGVKLMF